MVYRSSSSKSTSFENNLLESNLLAPWESMSVVFLLVLKRSLTLRHRANTSKNLGAAIPRVFVHMCVYINIFIYIHVYVYVFACMLALVHSCVHALAHACMHARTHVLRVLRVEVSANCDANKLQLRCRQTALAKHGGLQSLCILLDE